MEKEKMIEILNKKIKAAAKDFEYWNSKCNVSFAKLDTLKDLLDELLLEEENEKWID